MYIFGRIKITVLTIHPLMKFTFSLLLTSLFFTSLWAQPLNDECATLIDLGVVPSCESTVYTTIDATTSDLGNNNVPSCFNNGVTLRDVFFTFTPDTDIADYTIRLQGVADGPNSRPLSNPQFTLYRGADCTALSEVVCAAAGPGATVVSAVVPIPLTAGTNYFLRINDYSNSAAPNWGDFTICIEEYVAPIIMGETPTTSRCSGTVFDAGGDTNDYGPNLNQTLTICPTEAHECIAFDVESFGIIGDDQLNIYAGNGTGGPLAATLNGVSSGEDFRIFVNTDECATLQFISDAFTSAEGFILNWECSATPCGSSLDNPIVIPSLPFNGTFSTCDQGATFNSTTCVNAPFLNGPETVFVYETMGGSCANIELVNAEPGTGIVILDAPPTDPDANCVRVSTTGNIRGADFEIPGTYYIVVANAFGCTNFGLRIQEGPCTTATSLVDALCNPLNGCIQDGDLTTTFRFEDDNQDLELNEQNDGCWGGVGTQADFFWFTIQAQADGPFGFILQSANVPSDIDFNVWGPFTEAEVCDDASNVIDQITNGEPIRSSYAGGTEPTGLADIHPEFGYPIEDEYDCDGGLIDDIVRTIDARQGEVYVVLVNDWGDNILDGAMQVDWSPSEPSVLDPIELEIIAGDTSVCANQPVPIIVQTRIDNIRWIGENATQLSCTDCFEPIAIPSQTTTYRAVLATECQVDTIEVNVEVFNLDAGPDIEVCQQSTFEIPAGPDFAMATYTWNPPAGLTFSCTECATPIVTTTDPGVFTVPVVLDAGACRFTDEVIVTVLAGEAPTINIADDLSICQGESVEIGGAFVDGQVYNWTAIPVDPNLIASVANPDVAPDQTTTYRVEVISGFCPVSSTDSITVTVAESPLLGIVQQDVAVCLGDTIGLSNVIFEQDVDYSWTGPGEILNPQGPGTLVVPTVSGTYTVTANRGECTTTATTSVTVTPIELDLNQPDTLQLCLGESVTLTPAIQPADGVLSWNQMDISGNSPTLAPTETTTYIATIDNGACVRMDTLFIQVDSLPQDMSIAADPEKDPYCQGELVQLTSPIFDPFDFPRITFEWEGPGQETADSLYNLVLTTADTFTYRRTATNGACVSVDTIRLNVFRNDLTITPATPEICPGDTVQLEVSGTATELGELTWMPTDGLSCTDCPNPMAFPSSTTTYTVESSFNDCTTSQSVTVSVIEPPALNVINDQSVCSGTSLQLNNVTGQAGVTYTWTNNIDPEFSSDVANLTVTFEQTATYTVVADNGCESRTDEVAITVIQDASISSVSDALAACAGETISLSANVQESSNAPFTSSVWLYAGESELGPEASFNATNSGVATFIYQYGLSETELCAELRETVAITVDEAPMVDIIPDATACFGTGAFFVLNNLSAEPGVSYNWSSPDNPDFSSMEADPEVSPLTTTTYDLVATIGNCIVNESVTITVIQPATLLAGEDQVVTTEDPVANLTATVTGDDGAGSFEWAIVDGVVIGTTANVDYPVEPVAPQVAVVTYDNGCQILTDTVQIVGLDYQVPNFFSPNNDNSNDVFRPFFVFQADAVEVFVYNRWGQLVFEANDPDPDVFSWDGRFNDQPAPADVYIYKIRVTLDGVTIEQDGQVTLAR
jgi:gliding motility-associated-like protein